MPEIIKRQNEIDEVRLNISDLTGESVYIFFGTLLVGNKKELRPSFCSCLLF